MKKMRPRTRWIALACIAAVLALGTSLILGAGDTSYQEGRRAMDRKDWREAVNAFRDAADEGGSRADAALYWQGYALSKLGRSGESVKVLEELMRSYPDSKWVDDARELMGEVRGGGNPRGNEGDEELKLIALTSLMENDPRRAVPLFEKFLGGNYSDSAKEQAIFLVLQTGSPQAMELVAKIATGGDNVHLQAAAVRSLGIVGGAQRLQLLGEIYESSTTGKVKKAVLEAFMISGEAEHLVTVAKNESDAKLRGDAIEYLGVMGADAELEQLYTNETSERVRKKMLEAFMISGERERVLRIARDESSPGLREKAVEMLGVMGAVDELEQLYAGETSVVVKRALLQAFMISGADERMYSAATEESDAELRAEAVQFLGVMGATQKLGSLYESETEKEIRSAILQALFIAGDASKLAALAKSESDVDLQAEAIRSLSLTGHGGDTLLEFYEGDSPHRIKEAVLEGLFLQHDAKTLIRIARKEKDPELKRTAVRYLALVGSDDATDFMLEMLDE